MRILVVGRGWVGRKLSGKLQRQGHHSTTFSHEPILQEFDRIISLEKIDWIINCAGMTGVPNVDACELNPVETLNANTGFPIALQRKCEQAGIRFGHVSSGCIYQGIITDVNALPNFFGSIYSISKGLSDSYLGSRAQVYRIRMPFTNMNEPKNTLTKIINYAKTAKLIEGGANSLTHLDEAVDVMVRLISENQPNGYYNLVNQGSVTMHELVELLGIDPQWFTPEEFASITTAGRSNCVIPSHEYMRPLRDALHEAITLLQ